MDGDRRVHYDVDPIDGSRLEDPYYEEAVAYCKYYYDLQAAAATSEAAAKRITLMPQPGPQWYFLRNSADIIIYGGSAGAGKTYAVTLEGTRNLQKQGHTTAVFRRNKEQLKKPGGPWSEALGMYSSIPGTIIRDSAKEFQFPLMDKNNKIVKDGLGAIIKYDGLEYDSDKLAHQGAQYATIIYDELTHFLESQFTYMISRNRSPQGHHCSIKATTNPETGSWVRNWIDWFLWPPGSTYPEGYKTPTGEDLSGQDCGGLPIRERSGKIIYYITVEDEDGNGKMAFAKHPQDLYEEYGPDATGPSDEEPFEYVKSITFISASVYDNPKLLESNPQYLANLKSLPKVERDGLLGGNWDACIGGGLYFKREWVGRPLVSLPDKPMTLVRYWDRAATKPGPKNRNPDWTVGALVGKDTDGMHYVLDIVRFRDTPSVVEQIIKETAEKDPAGTIIYLEQDPGQAGVADVANYMKLLSKYTVRANKVTKSKLVRGLPFSAAAENELVKFMAAPWLNSCFAELENFDPESDKFKDDQWDAVTGAYSMLQDEVVLLSDIELPEEFSGMTHGIDSDCFGGISSDEDLFTDELDSAGLGVGDAEFLCNDLVLF